MLSIDKNKDEYIDNGARKLKIYPDEPNEICKYIKDSGLMIEKIIERDFAYIFVCHN